MIGNSFNKLQEQLGESKPVPDMVVVSPAPLWYHGTTEQHSTLRAGTWFASSLSEALVFLRFNSPTGFVAVVSGHPEEIGELHIVDPEAGLYHLRIAREMKPIQWVTSEEALKTVPAIIQKMFDQSTKMTRIDPKFFYSEDHPMRKHYAGAIG